MQGRLFGGGAPAVDRDTRFERRTLDERSWVDVARDFLRGADAFFVHLRDQVPWTQGRRWMYDREVDDPRLSCWYEADQPLPHEALVACATRWARATASPSAPPELNYYRDGRDSVASHRDRELRYLDDTLIAIVTLGGQRPFLVRSSSGGPSIDLSPASGDLLVMGGACQRGFEHGVPKVVHAEPRTPSPIAGRAGPSAPSGAGARPR